MEVMRAVFFTETHGAGSTCAEGKNAFTIASGLSGYTTKWLGTVWAPYGAINIGARCDDYFPGSVVLTGAVWSGTQVSIQKRVTINFAPYLLCDKPNVNAGPDKQIDCSNPTVVLSGSSTTANAIYAWASLNGGHIASGTSTANPFVDAAGKYVLTVTDPNGGCVANDTVLVQFIPCVLPYYPPPDSGKITNLIGAELTSLSQNFTKVKDSSQNIFILQSDSVFIEVIARTGQYSTLLALLKTVPYGITDLIDNGPNTLIISGKFPIINLKK